MEITITTATITIGKTAVPLSRAIVHQIPYLPGTLPKDWSREGIACIGSVDLPDAIWYLYSTPAGVHKCKSLLTTLGNLGTEPQRIILTK